MMSLDLDDSGSDRVKEYKELINHVAEESVKLDVLDFFPSLGYVFPHRIKGWLTIYIGRLFDLFDRIIDERLEARKEQKYVSTNDMLDSLLSLTEDNKEHIDRNSIKHLFMNLLIAGTDTTSSTFEWAMAEILRNPETIKKARAEIEKKMGRNQKMVHESDVAELPYLRAIVKETFRLHPVAPILIPRKTTEDIEIEGYFIPKDTQVIVNAWKIGRDPSLWGNPEKFMPERFLESEIDPGGQHFELIPFGGGRRMCARMPLAIRMLHSMVGSLIYRFDWKLEDGVKPENVDMNENSSTIVHMATPLRAIPVQLNY